MADIMVSMAQKGDASRQRIVETASRLFYQRGYNQTSFSDIADAAAIPRGNFYYHFKTKEDILAAVIDYRIAKVRTMLGDWERLVSDPRARLRRFVQMLGDSARELSRYGCPMGSLNIELGKAQPRLKAKARKMFDLFRDWLAEQLMALGHKNAGDLALHLLGRAQGIAVVAHVYGNQQHLKDELEQLEAWLDQEIVSWK